jgi:SDR family mycofactocin-dependent oxidoreductase
MGRMGRVDGKVAFVTGAAQGQGQAHCLRLAEEGADIIAIDVCEQSEIVSYPMGTEEGLAETADRVRGLGRRVVASRADVRDNEGLAAVLHRAVVDLGRLDIVVANAGISTIQTWDKVTPRIWQETLDTNLTGVWHTCRAAIPHLIDAGGGSIVITSSTAGLKGLPYLAPYVASKHALVGLARSLANELASAGIRVNTVHPTGVATPMGQMGEEDQAVLLSDPLVSPIFMNTIDVEVVDPIDIANAVLFLASDEARYVTGAAFPVDAGNTIR